MRKILLKSAIIAVLFAFAACSSDSGGSSCNEAALEAEFEAAVEKYLTSGSNADCLAVVDVINKALANKCITQEEADSYGAGLDCYSSGGNTGGDDESEM